MLGYESPFFQPKNKLFFDFSRRSKQPRRVTLSLLYGPGFGALTLKQPKSRGLPLHSYNLSLCTIGAKTSQHHFSG